MPTPACSGRKTKCVAACPYDTIASMDVHSSPTAASYAEAVTGFLRVHSVEHSVLLTRAAKGDIQSTDEPNLWLWVTDEAGDVVAVANHTPPHRLYLSLAPEEAVRTIARHLWNLGRPVLGVGGLDRGPEIFAEEWRRLGGPDARIHMSLGMFECHDVTTPHNVKGHLRAATQADAATLRPWATELSHETDQVPPHTDLIGPRVDDGLLYVWEEDGQPVSMAALTRPADGVCRVQLAFTPPALRGQGFASGCVSAMTKIALDRGDRVMLFTDLSNPTSNSIYQRMGYQRIGGTVDLDFPRVS